MLKSNSKEKGKYCEAKEEEMRSSDGQYRNFATSSRPQWSRNPRIVRVSRSFGGKDRHSKVCTIRGLRDRRIRLSVPTAIQLYDLQDRLKLGQPSKVIDWLLDVTKLDIDKLPPLQIPNGFSPFHQQMLFPNSYHEYSTTTTTTSSSSSSLQFCSLPPNPPTFPLDIASRTTVEKGMNNWDVMDLGLQEKAAMKGKWVNHGGNNNNNNNEVHDQDHNNSNCYNYNSCDQPYSCLSLSQFGNGALNVSQAEAAQTSSSLFFTPYANNSYITNPLFENHIHFLTSNSHALSNPFMSSSLHPFASQNLKFFPPNFNSKHHGGPGKDGAPNDA